MLYLPEWPQDVLWRKLNHTGWRDYSQQWLWFAHQSEIQGDQYQSPRTCQAKHIIFFLECEQFLQQLLSGDIRIYTII